MTTCIAIGFGLRSLGGVRGKSVDTGRASTVALLVVGPRCPRR